MPLIRILSESAAEDAHKGHSKKNVSTSLDKKIIFTSVKDETMENFDNHFLVILLESIGVIHLLRNAFRGWGVWDFVTVQTKKIFVHRKFVTKGGGGSKKLYFCVT